MSKFSNKTRGILTRASSRGRWCAKTSGNLHAGKTVTEIMAAEAETVVAEGKSGGKRACRGMGRPLHSRPRILARAHDPRVFRGVFRFSGGSQTVVFQNRAF